MASEEEDFLKKFDEAEEASEEYSEWMSELKKVRQELAQTVTEKEEEGEISTTKSEEILNDIQNGQYGTARQKLKDALEKPGLEFDAEEKSVFAQNFEEAFNDLTRGVERIRNDLVELKNGVDRDDLVAYLYGKHSKFTKKELREVMDVIDRIEKQETSDSDLARMLWAYNSDLTLSHSQEIVEAIRKEVEK
jgi:hypothetical protein